MDAAHIRMAQYHDEPNGHAGPAWPGLGPAGRAAGFPEAKTIEKPLVFEASMLKMLKKRVFLLVFLLDGTSRGLKMLKNHWFLKLPC